eukprot:15364621-Ditylum_brightwellii.AAC.1
MAPPGTKCFIHIKPHKRASWRFHAEDAWYVGPALKHYRCYMVVMKQSIVQRITDTIRFKHHNVKLSTVTPAERIQKAVKELTNAVKTNPTEGPANYIEVIQCLKAVVLGEKQQPREQAETVTQRNPHQSAEHPAIIKAMLTTAWVPQKKLRDITAQPATTKSVPNNTPPSRSPALIPYNEDEVEPPSKTMSQSSHAQHHKNITSAKEQ